MLIYHESAGSIFHNIYRPIAGRVLALSRFRRAVGSVLSGAPRSADLSASRSSQGCSVLPKAHALLVALAACHDQIAGLRHLASSVDRFAAVGNADECIAFDAAFGPQPAAIIARMSSRDSVRGSSAVKTVISASRAEVCAIMRRFRYRAVRRCRRRRSSACRAST